MPDWTGRRIFITGGTGFIGTNLVRRLVEEEAQVFVLVRPQRDAWRLKGVHDRISFLRGDLASEIDVLSAVKAARPEIIFHLATARVPEQEASIPLFFSLNILSASRLISAACDVGVKRLVVAGSSLEYGHSRVPHAESDPLCPSTLHGAMKASATILFQLAAQRPGLSSVILRLFHVYGPWESPDRLVPTALRAALRGEELRLTEKGIRRDFVYVEDVVDSFLMAAQRSDLKDEVINIGSGVQTSNEELVEAVERITGRPISIRFGGYEKKPYDTDFRVADIRKAAALLLWQPRHDLHAGLQATHDWMKSCGHSEWSSKSVSLPSAPAWN